MQIKRKGYGLDYYWRNKWLFVSAPRHIAAKPGGVTVIFAILPKRIAWQVAGKNFKGWDLVGVFKFWYWNIRQK